MLVTHVQDTKEDGRDTAEMAIKMLDTECMKEL